jgi:hypothetical protein
MGSTWATSLPIRAANIGIAQTVWQDNSALYLRFLGALP